MVLTAVLNEILLKILTCARSLVTQLGLAAGFGLDMYETSFKR